MINNDRRNFIFKSTMLAASGVLTACGGGGGDGAAAAGAEPALAGAAPDPANAVDPAPVETAAVVVIGPPLAGATIRLSALSAVKSAPYCLGYAFRRGDVPAGKVLVGDTGKIQVIPKNVWPDGSLKFAVISGHADVTAAAETNVGLVLVAAPTTIPSQLSTAKLRATEIVAAVGCGSYGTVNWSGADWDAPFQTWVQGPVMSSWIYRKPVGTDAHLVAWLEVRLWASGAVEVLPWIENGYLRVAAPSNKSTTFTFTLGKTQRMSAAIDLKHHQRTPLINGTALSYWLAADPGVIARHNTTYLQATELVPTYQAVVDASSTAVTRLPVTYLPLQAGSFNFDGDSMAASGYQDPIGLLPQHDVLYLTTDAKIAYAGVIRNGFSAGRYALHYRDETTNRPLRFSSYPTLNIGSGQGFKDTGGSTTGSYTPAPTGGNGPGWDVAHSPSVGYMAYLVTGRWYFMEEVQFATTANYLGNGDNQFLRVGSKGLVKAQPGAWQTRSCAWDWRTRVQALCVTPDADIALRSEFIASVEANIEFFHNLYIARPNNPYGWIKPGESYSGTLREGAPWQQDFVTAAFGYSVSLGMPISNAATSKLAAFFQWKARSAVMRLGPKEAFWYVNAVPYSVAITPSNAPNYDNGTGPWYATEAEVYRASYAVEPSWMGKVDGILAGEIMPGAKALWGNLMPAIAYAVRHNVPGAKEAYNRILSAGNWSKLRDEFNTRPVWSVRPADGALLTPPVVVAPVQPAPTNPGAPAWAANAPLNAWMEIPGTAGADGSSIDAYSGFAVKQSTGEILIALAGGHGDGHDTRVSSIRLLDDAPSWKSPRRKEAATADIVLKDSAYYADGVTPSSRHTRYSTQYSALHDRIMFIGTTGVYGVGGTQFAASNGFSLQTNTWDAPGTWASSSNGAGTAQGIDDLGNIWTRTQKWIASTNTMVNLLPGGGTVWGPQGIAFDRVRRQMFSLQYGDNQGYSVFLGYQAKTLSEDLSSLRTITFNASAAWAEFQTIPFMYTAIEYVPLRDVFFLYDGASSRGGPGTVWVITPNAGTVWDISKLTQGAGSVIPVATVPAGIQNKFRYVDALKGIIMLPSAGANLYYMRLE
jgi:hypothetical protein